MMKKHMEEGNHTKLVKQEGDALSAGHISRKQFCDWQEGRLKGREETDFFTHIGACTFCAEQFGSWMEEGILDELEPDMEPGSDGEAELELGKNFLLEEPPRYLKEEILNRTRQFDLQASVKLQETSRKVQLMVYSLKVGLAVAASIFILTVTCDIRNMNLELSRDQQMEQAQEEKTEPGKREREESLAGKLRRGSKEISATLNELSSGLFRIEMDTSESKRNQEVTR
jgi:hypothetical protein